jgi:hypothetical protein
MPDDDLSVGGAHFAEGDSEEARERLRDRLAADKGPSTASSTSRWKTGGDIFRAGGRTPDATKVTIGDLEQMRRDPILSFGLSFIKAYLARANWYIKSTDPRRAAFIDGALRRIYGRFILQYGGSLDFGFQAMVKNFERAPVDWVYLSGNGPDAQEVRVWSSSADPLLWKPFSPLNPRHVTPAWDADGNFAGINYRNTQAGSRFPFEEKADSDGKIGLDWALWATNEKDSVFGSLYGWPRLGYAYRFWWAYWYRFGLADRAFEKWADPPVIAYHPTELATDDEGNPRNFTQEALGLAEKLRSGANVSLPSSAVESQMDGRTLNLRSWELKHMEVNTNFDALNESFEYLDVSRLRALMVPEQAFFEGKGGTSSRNVAATLGSTFEDGQAIIKAEIDDQINRYMIPQLLEANFGPGGPTCEIVTTGFEDQDVETGRAIVQALAQNAPAELASVDIRELLKRLGVPILNPIEAKKQQEDLIEHLQSMKPPPQSARGNFAGVDENGRYFKEEEIEEIKVGLEDRIREVAGEVVESKSVELSEKIDGDFNRFSGLLSRLLNRDPVVNVTVQNPDLEEKPIGLSEEDRALIERDAEERRGFMEAVKAFFSRKEPDIHVHVPDTTVNIDGVPIAPDPEETAPDDGGG